MVAATYTVDFDRLWQVYPRRSGKGAAFRAFQKLKCVNGDVEVIIASVERHKRTAQWAKDGGQFIPHLSTFLNQRRFEDEPEVGGFNGKPNRAEQQFIDNHRAKEQASDLLIHSHA